MLRKISSTFVVLICLTFQTYAQQVVMSDDANYVSTASSALLDVKSTNKGVLLPRVALNSLTDNATVTSPINGLLVYNNGTGSLTDKGVYYWNDSVWVKALNGGYGSNRVSISDDGTLILKGNASCFNDLVVNPYTALNNGTSKPNWTKFIEPSIFTWEFIDGSDSPELFFMVQMPHNYKEGSTIYPHVHWSSTTAPGTNRVKWVLDYQWVNLGSSFTATTSTSVNGYTIADSNPSKSLAAYESTITVLGTSGISGTGRTISSILLCRLHRLSSDVNDTFSGSAFLLSFDFHYEIDSFGSNGEYTK